MDVDALRKSVSQERGVIIESMRGMLRINAVGPESGGPGEAERGRYLVALARKLGFATIEVLESSDPRVPAGKRPNIIVRMPGTGKRRMWVITHMDTVPEGDINAWKYPPFEGTVVDGKIYGRGAEDNGQELMASLFGAHALLKLGIKPEFNVGLVFVSDEEHGNTHGIDFLLAKGLFKKDDLVIVPDHGQPDGTAISVVEKSSAWIQVEVSGRQTHASTPEKGVNALEAAARYIVLSVDRLRRKFSTKDPLFEPPVSTFEPTRCEANGPNINTVPGRQVFAFDFRVLPEYDLDDIMRELQKSAKEVERSSGAKIKLSYLNRSDAAPKTSTDSEIVKRLASAIEAVRGVKVHPIGIGGGTCAAPFRRKGIEAAVWSTIPETAHDANEYANIADIVSDAQVYAVLFAGKNID
ncbi:MAG: M20 family metallo-hydrolase [Candidatus Thermoplasmatota archaeon]|nr:M20 family metallo-hydrolase [Candidatus Thermoplasmatota archaeon]